ncbi:hypothetical protein LEP1GSC170_4805 [Leptospira interrogans serovar Bataviae str. HAI135]|nr:hypothetical protein LEP1GSC170_4805 [Leptospira interrogans serovar Bataviae str. HAI135]
MKLPRNITFFKIQNNIFLNTIDFLLKIRLYYHENVEKNLNSIFLLITI